MDELEQAQAMVGELAAMIEHYCTVEGGVAAGFAKLGEHVQEGMEFMEEQGKPHPDVFDALMEALGVFAAAHSDYSHLPLPSPPSPSH